MENYIEKHINEGFNIRNRVLTFTDDNENVLNTSLDGPATSETIYGVRKYTDEKIKTLSNTAFKVSRIEEGNEGILVFSPVISYVHP